MPSVGYATLQVIPSVRGISNDIRRQLVGPAGDAGQQAGQAAGGGLRDKLKLGAAAAGAAAGAVLVKGLTDALDQANITSTLQAQLGTSAKVASQQGKLAGKLYSSGVSGSFQEAADAIKSVMQAGLAPPGATTKQLEVLATKASDVANVFGQDLGGVTNAVSQMMRTGLAKNSTEAFDVITKGFQAGADKGGDLLDTVNEYGTSFRTLGLNGRDAMGLLSQGLKGGARDADQVADALKEFSLVASQGGKATEGTFKSIGLNGKQIVKDVAAGGDSARDALAKVLSTMQKLPNSAAKASAVKTLFGGPGEDLGAALFSLNLNKAGAALGTFDGAADKVGKTIRSGPSHEIEVFTRTLKQGFVDFIGGQVLPVVSTLAHGFNTYLLPPLRVTASVVAAVLIPALAAVWQAGGAVVSWLQDMGTWLIPIGIAVGGLTLAMTANAIATGAVTAVFAVYRAAMIVGTAVTNGMAAAQGFLNLVMRANPIILVVTAVLALGAALVVAYQRSETFRGIVQGAWAGIQTAASVAWNSVIKPALAGFMTGLRAVGTAVMWLWTTILQPALSGIGTAAKILAVVIVVAVVAPIVAALKVFGAIGGWLWKTAIGPAFRGIGALGKWLWFNVLAPAFAAARVGFRALGQAGLWLWRNALGPAFRGSVAVGRLFASGVKASLGLVRSYILGPLASGFRYLRDNVVKPVMSGIRSTISTVVNAGIKPVFNALKSATGQVVKSFIAAKNGIKAAWDKVKGIAKAPVAFVIKTVYNGGIVPVWNKVASAFGAPELDKIKGWATGGPVFGAGTETSDDVPAWLSRNEHVWTAKEVRGAGGHGAVMAMRKWAAAGGTGALPGFKDGGGLFGWIGSAASTAKGWGSAAWDKVKEGASWLKDTLAGSVRAGVNAVVKPLIKRIPGLDNAFGRAIANLPNKMIDALFGYADKADKKGASDSSFGGGKIPKGQHKAIITRALKAAGVPPPGSLGQWLSGLNTLITRESGWNASAINRTDSNAKAGHPSQGLAQTIPGTFNAYVPKSLRSRGILDPVANVAAAIRYIVANYGNITKVQQANANASPKGYAGGGHPRAGELAWVGEKGPELVRFGAGGATVWDAHTSQELAAGLMLRGFAKGTSGARARAAARKDIPGDLAGASKALTASAADIKKAFDELTKDLRAAGGAGKTLAASSAKASAKLQALAKQRDSVAQRLADAKQAASDQKKAAADFFSLSNLGTPDSVADLVAQLRNRQGTVKNFQSVIASLSKKGLDQSLIQQLVAQGPDSALAGLLAGASTSQIGQLNALAKTGASLSTSFGRTMADAMYDAGKNASKGFLTGLQSQDKELQAAMNKLGSGLVRAIKKALKIKSPSRVTMPLGASTGQGFAIGLDSTAAQVASAAARVSDAALPAVAAPRPAATGPAGLQPGNKVRLVVRDREFDAFLEEVADDRVAAGLDQVRRAYSRR